MRLCCICCMPGQLIKPAGMNVGAKARYTSARECPTYAIARWQCSKSMLWGSRECRLLPYAQAGWALARAAAAVRLVQCREPVIARPGTCRWAAGGGAEGLLRDSPGSP